MRTEVPGGGQTARPPHLHAVGLPGASVRPTARVRPVIPVRLTGVEKVLHRADRFPRPGPVKVAFGMPLLLKGENFEELASQVRRAVSEL